MVTRKAKDDSYRRFKSEAEAKAYILPLLQKHFELYEEVEAVGYPDNQTYRMDALTICHQTGYVLGWEFKKSHLFKAEFVDCLRQAIYYRLARITDKRLPKLTGQRVNACIAFPGWDGLHDDGTIAFGREAQGMLLLASHFRVGAIASPKKMEGISIKIGESGVWHSWSGWTGNAAGVLKNTRPLGSLRKLD